MDKSGRKVAGGLQKGAWSCWIHVTKLSKLARLGSVGVDRAEGNPHTAGNYLREGRPPCTVGPDQEERGETYALTGAAGSPHGGGKVWHWVA